jgi:tetratricopeptide (TPR) repeat protein
MGHLTIYLVYMLFRRRPSVNFGGSGMRRTFWLTILITALLPLGAQDYLARGEKLLNENKPDQALVFLQAGLETGTPSQKLYHYLALSYQSLGQNQKALEAIEKGLALSGDLTYLLSYNKGNVLFQEGQYSAAEEAYNRSLGLAPDFNSNILNRANARLQQAKYADSLGDYKLYQELEPSNSQRRQIDEIIALLGSGAIGGRRTAGPGGSPEAGGAG